MVFRSRNCLNTDKKSTFVQMASAVTAVDAKDDKRDGKDVQLINAFLW